MRAWIGLMVAVVLNGCTAVDPKIDKGDQGMSERWERLSAGQALGKKSVITIATQPAGGVAISGQVDLLNIKGDDADACQMVVTLTPPTAILLSHLDGGVFPPDPQNISTSYPYDALYASGIPAAPATEDFCAPPAIAIVRWGVGGIQSRAEVDFSYGATINLQASFVRVDAFVDVPTETFYPGVAVTLGAFIGPGNTGLTNAQRTYAVHRLTAVGDAVYHGYPNFGYGPNGYIAAAGPGPDGIRLYPVPAFAKQAWVLGEDLAGVTPHTFDADFIFYRDIYTGSKVGVYHAGIGTPGPVPVPNGAAYWSLHNNLATDKIVAVTFDLSI